MTVRVSPPRVFPEASRASRPPAAPAGPADAYRQSSFVLAPDIERVVEGLNLEGELAQASSGARYRNQVMAASVALWSRSWLCRLQALHALEWGNYAAAIPLIRAAADYQASMALVLQEKAAEWQRWLDGGGIALAPADHATEFRLHAFRAGEVLAADEVLGPIYRVATDLSLSHFGATATLVAADSDPNRVQVTFGDRDFHLALSELCLGWLLQLGGAATRAVGGHPEAFSLEAGDRLAAWRQQALTAADGRDRCRVEIVERSGEQRYLIHNWRRAPGGAPKRLLL